MRKEIDQNLQQKFSLADKEVSDYRQAKLKEVDQRIYQILSEVASKTLGKALDLAAHEQLVLDALEKAMKEKLF
jgi:hypothetical protein